MKTINLITAGLASITVILLGATVGLGAELSGNINMRVNQAGVVPTVSKTNYLNLGLISGQLSDSGHLADPNTRLSGDCNYTVAWQSKVFTNGTWFFASLNAQASASRTGLFLTNSRMFNQIFPRHSVRLNLKQSPAGSGETDYTGIQVKLRYKIRVRGNASVTEVTSAGSLNNDVLVAAAVGEASDFSPNSLTKYWKADSPDLGHFDVEQWLPPVQMTVNDNSPTGRETVLSANVYASADNTDYLSASTASISTSVVISDFQVLDSSDNLIWDYTPNADSSPGDKFYLQIVGSGTPAVLSPGAPTPFTNLRLDTNGDMLVDFLGELEESSDLNTWIPVDPPVISPYRIVNSGQGSRLFRSHFP